MIANWFSSILFGVTMLATVGFGVLLVREGWREQGEDEGALANALKHHPARRSWMEPEAIMAMTALTLALAIVSLS